MATGSLKKRSNKRQNLKQPTPMASRPNPSSSHYKKGSLVFPVLLGFSVIVLLGISPIMWNRFKVDASIPKIYTIEVVNEFPHDPEAFTQGLLYTGNDTLFESTGLYYKSSVRKVALRTGKVEDIQKMDGSYFGEGLTLFGERLFQVTWRENTGFIYDQNDLSKVEKFTHQMQDGWGLATDGKVLFGSDGTSTLYQIDPKKLKVIGKHIVKYKGQEVHNLNELEFINSEVWANIWQSNCIARISPENGRVLGWILLQNLSEGLVASGNNAIDVLNGIAWDNDKKRIFVTGKLWPKLFEIKLHPVKKQFNSGAIEQLCLRKPFNFGNP